MKPKTKVSQREIWLLALLPAALVLIISLALPSPANDIPDLERRLEALTKNEAEDLLKLRELSKQIKQSREEMGLLEENEADLLSQIDSLKNPNSRLRQAIPDMAGALDELTRRLSDYGIQVLATNITSKGAGQKSGAVKRPTAEPIVGKTEWVVSLAATWPALSQALADTDVIPKGLVLSAMNMEPVQTSGTLRRWELVFTVAEQSL